MSADKQIYRIKIRDNATFQNDTPITTDDVIFSLESAYIDRNFNLEKIDDKNFNLKLKKPSGENILEKLDTPIVPKNVSPDLQFSLNLVGSGFFKIAR